MRNRILIFSFVFLAFGLSGCKDGITSHNIDMDGVMHGKKLHKGAKNCTACHGIALKGNGWIPSCYECHNVMWNKDNHKVNKKGVMHKSGYFNAKSNCGNCHGGQALTGKRSRPSCFKCHGDKWTALEMHNVSLSGRYHAPGYFSPTTKGCTSCHGATLKGGSSAPSCYTCHGAKWLYASYRHTRVEDGIPHGPDLFNPSSFCISCHGFDLRGTSDAPSCYRCHGKKW